LSDCAMGRDDFGKKEGSPEAIIGARSVCQYD